MSTDTNPYAQALLLNENRGSSIHVLLEFSDRADKKSLIGTISSPQNRKGTTRGQPPVLEVLGDLIAAGYLDVSLTNRGKMLLALLDEEGEAVDAAYEQTEAAEQDANEEEAAEEPESEEEPAPLAS